MKIRIALLLLSLAAAPAFAADAPKVAAEAEAKAAAKGPYKNDNECAIYTIGFLMGRDVAAFYFSPAEAKVLSAGLLDAVTNKPPVVDISLHQSRINEMLQRRMEAGAAKEKEKSKTFIDQFVKENKPLAIPAGGWYLEQKAGNGPTPVSTETIKAHYRGTTIDGAEFDSSYSRGEPTEFALNRVIACWTHGITMMKAGGKAKLVCPSEVAYGDTGRPGIKPGATLIFEVELIEIVKQAPPARAKDAKKK